VRLAPPLRLTRASRRSGDGQSSVQYWKYGCQGEKTSRVRKTRENPALLSVHNHRFLIGRALYFRDIGALQGDFR
jgi:hypothetical protein